MFVHFCKCGRVLDREYNKHYNEKCPGFCNDKCRASYESKSRRTNQKKYGVTGDLYMSEKRIVVMKKESIDEVSREVGENGMYIK